MLTEENKVDKIEVLEQGQIQIRTANIIKRDDEEISRSYHRHVLNPTDDITNEDTKVQAIANATWTEEVVEGWKTSQEILDVKQTND